MLYQVNKLKKAETCEKNPYQKGLLFHTQLSGPGIETIDWSACKPPLAWFAFDGGRVRVRVARGATVLGSVPSLVCAARGRVVSLLWPADRGSVPSLVCRTVPSDFGVCGDEE